MLPALPTRGGMKQKKQKTGERQKHKNMKCTQKGIRKLGKKGEEYEKESGKGEGKNRKNREQGKSY